jgi:dUTP pyrophosphatase
MNNSNNKGPTAFNRTYKSVHGTNGNTNNNRNYNNNNSNYSNNNSGYNNSNYSNNNGSSYQRTPRKTNITIKNVYVEKNDGYTLPVKASRGSIGYDLFANEDVIIGSQKVVAVNTGLKMAIPLGYEMQIRCRSGLCVNNCIMVMNSPATIDWDYRGEVKVILYNLNQEEFVIKKGDRIAQAVFAPVIFVRFNEVDQLTNHSQNTRGEQGFGASGTSGKSNYNQQEESYDESNEVDSGIDQCSSEESFTTECNM